MPLIDVRDRTLDGWSGESDDPDAPPVESGTRPVVRTGLEGLWRRVAGAPARLRSALRARRGDPEPRAIREAAETLERGGGVVFAKLEGWPRPPVVQGFVPDVYAVFEDREIVLSFENEGSVERAAAQQREGAFTAWAAGSSRRIHEQILVSGGRGGARVGGVATSRPARSRPSRWPWRGAPWPCRAPSPR